MSLVRKEALGQLVNDDSPRAVHVRSIQVSYKDVQRKRPVTVEIKTDSERFHRSRQYRRHEAIDWNIDMQFALATEPAIVVREHRQLHSDKESVIPITITDDLFIKPILNINEPNGKKISLRIYFEAAGPFIDLIRHLVETSQSKLGSMKDFMKNVGRACEVLNYIVNTMELASNAHPGVGTAVSAVKDLYEKCKDVKECYEAAASLMADVASFLPFVEVPQARSRSNISNETADKILELFEKISRMIIEYSDNTAIGIFLRSRIDDVDAYKEELRRLKETFDWCIKTEVWKAVLTTEKHTEALVLDKLQPVMQAFYEREKTCFEGTRKETLQAIEDWSTSDSKLFWLYGSAGAGKSTIAHTVAQRFREQKRLAGCFFCNRNNANEKLRDPNRIMPTIAYQFAKWHADYRSIIVDMLEGEGELDLNAGLQDQFDLLVQQPLSRSSVHLPPGHRPLVVIIDALDQCSDSANSRRYLAEFIVDIANSAPWLKVFVSSAKSEQFEACLLQDGAQYLDISDPSLDLQDDVVTYVQHCTESYSVSCTTSRNLAYKTPQLLSRFYWAFQAFGDDSRSQADDLEMDAFTQNRIDGFLHVAVHGILKQQKWPDLGENLEPIVRDIIALTCSAVSSPLVSNLSAQLSEFLLAEEALNVLCTVISFVEPIIFNRRSHQTLSLCPSHVLQANIPDQEQLRQFCTNIALLNTTLAHGCLDAMHIHLKFNICGLQLSYLENADILDLPWKIMMNIADVLQYGCLYWMDHMLQSHDAESFHSSVKQLLCSAKALFWIEVLGLLGMLEKGKEILLQCAGHFKEVDVIARAATELHGFISVFHDAIAVSTSHLYVSALTWFQPNFLVVQCASDAFMGRKSPLSDESPQHVSLANTSKNTLLQEADNSLFKGDTGNILEAKYTPDRRKIISTMYDCMVQIWDAKSGEAISESFKCHVPSICAIAYSRDGSRIASGSGDGKLRIWDAHTGVLVIESQEGHSNGIKAVAYSPDGTRIVTGSYDTTLRIWDAQSGACVGEPLFGHTGWVTAVAYAPDGHRIVSGSSDRTLRIWDAQSGAQVDEPLRGHKGRIWAVGYAPDGNRIVSGASDSTLRIWYAQSGKPIGEPLKGHNNPVTSVAYSPDGTRIVSGSMDRTLRVWDARSGTPVGEPLKGHGGCVRSVAYSPDGSRIVSGSDDQTVRIWDADSGEPIGEPLSGHENIVESVAYSPDGNEITSGSWDGTIRLWDAHNGACIKTMFPGESRWDPDAQCFLTVGGSNSRRLPIAHTTNPSTIPGDGWLRTLDGGLFLWVPPDHRQSICGGQVRIPNNEVGKLMYIDWTKIPHGEDWTKIMDVEGSDKD